MPKSKSRWKCSYGIRSQRLQRGWYTGRSENSWQNIQSRRHQNAIRSSSLLQQTKISCCFCLSYELIKLISLLLVSIRLTCISELSIKSFLTSYENGYRISDSLFIIPSIWNEFIIGEKKSWFANKSFCVVALSPSLFWLLYAFDSI